MKDFVPKCSALLFALLISCSEAGEPALEGDDADRSGESPTGGGAGTGSPGTGGTGENSGGTLSETSSGGASAAGGGALVGLQADPGTEGDGSFDQPGPYGAPPETLSRTPGAPAGVLVGSNFYDSPSIYPTLTFEYWIYVPAQYEPGKPAALMVFQDGSHYVGESASFNSSVVFDNLIHEGTMPVTLALFINPGSESPSGEYQYPAEVSIRSAQYDAPSDVFSRFLLEEAIPDLVKSQYDIVDDPEGWAIGGHSSGGIAALMAAWYRPQSFRKVLSHNASFPNTMGVFPQLIEDTNPNRPLRVFLLSSTEDINGMNPGSWFDTNNAAAAIFEAKRYHYRYLSGSGPHFPPTQSVAVYPDSLRWLWRGYSLPWYQ